VKLADSDDIAFMLRVYLDDFMNAAAVAKSSLQRLQWLTRATLYAIHALFPPPSVSGHEGGKDSISIKKLNKQDGRWMWKKELLGFLFDGWNRTVGITDEKADAYVAVLAKALSNKTVSLRTVREIHGKMQHVGQIARQLKGFMTPINRQLAKEAPTISLGPASALREVFTHCSVLINELKVRPTHVRQLVAPYLPHVLGYGDSCCLGAGGVWLPCTEYLRPTVYRVEYPPELRLLLQKQQRQKDVNNNDGEMAATLFQYAVLEQLRSLKYLSSVSYSDSQASVGLHSKLATRSDSPVPDRLLRAWATRMHALEAGPADVPYWCGEENDMADFASRAWHLSDDSFLETFSNTFPLPKQLGSWQLVKLPIETVSAHISILLQKPFDLRDWTAPTGRTGHISAPSADKTLSPPQDQLPPWNAASCSWPLLNASGQVDTTMTSRLAARKSRTRCAAAPRYSRPMDIQTPVELPPAKNA
jgi:hypothetical protein